MNMKTIYWIILWALATKVSEAKTVYVDQAHGVNSVANISNGKAVQSLEFAWPHIVSGDTVLLSPGRYAFPTPLGIDAKLPNNIFRSWVNVIGAGTSTVITNQLVFGADGGQYYGTNWSGTFDAFLRLSELHLSGGIEVYGARYLEVNSCKITIPGPWTGSAEAINRRAVKVRGGSQLAFESCEVTDTAIGFEIAAHNIVIRSNRIHDISHDGIRLTGVKTALIENNSIYNLDDGTADYVDGVFIPWSRHCDAIHIFMQEQGELYQNEDVVIRGNRMWNIESHQIQFNNFRSGAYHNKRIVVENNVFGGGGATAFSNAEACDGLIYRHNTVIVRPQPTTWRSPYRTLTNDNYSVLFSEASTGVAAYNNISSGPFPAHLNRRSHNLLLFSPSDAENMGRWGSLGRGDVMTTNDVFVNISEATGILKFNSLAINGGTALDEFGSVDPGRCLADVYGTERDARPDMGAYELPGQNPPPELGFPVLMRQRTVVGAGVREYIDDFEDGDWSADPFLDNERVGGIQWILPALADTADFSRFHLECWNALDGNYLSGYMGTNVASAILVENCLVSGEFSFAFDIVTTLPSGEGPCFYYSEDGSFYWINIGNSEATLRTSVGGVTSTVGSFAGVTLPYGVRHHVKVDVARLGTVNRITVTRTSSSGVVTSASVVHDASALGGRLMTGRVGFYRSSGTMYHRSMYDNIRLTLAPSAISPVNNLRIVQ